MLRSLAERLSRERVLKRHLPAEFGGSAIFVSPEGGLKYWRRDLSRVDVPLLRMARELVKPGNVVWDVGANVGLFTFASAVMAGSSGSVLALEADTWLVGLLRKSTRVDSSSRAPVEILPAAVSDSVDLARFFVAARARAASALEGFGTSQAGGRREEHLVVTVTLDWLFERRPAPHVLKVDVEGAEARVLAGAQKLLSEARPIIVCEVSGRNVDSVTQCLKALHYTLYDADLSQEMRTPLGHAVWNTVAYPDRT